MHRPLGPGATRPYPRFGSQNSKTAEVGSRLAGDCYPSPAIARAIWTNDLVFVPFTAFWLWVAVVSVLVSPGAYPKPIPFGGMGKPLNQNGFSDHFPIAMTIAEVD
jgi:hypothetical protein